MGKKGVSEPARRRQQARAGRLEVVAELYRRGCSMREIRQGTMARLGLKTLSLQTVHADIQQLLAEWREARVDDVEAALGLELRRIDEAIRELWAAWERSKAVSPTGDVRLIAEIRRQQEERRKLLGLYAPERHELTGREGEGIPLQYTVRIVSRDGEGDGEGS